MARRAPTCGRWELLAAGACRLPPPHGRASQSLPPSQQPALPAHPPTHPPAAQVLELLMERRDLSEGQASEALVSLVSGAEVAQMAAFLVLLRAKGETAEEVAGLAKAMRSLGVPVSTGYDGASRRGRG